MVVRIAAAADELLAASIVVMPDSTAIESAAERLESGNVRLVLELPKAYLPAEGVSAIDSAVVAATPFGLVVVVPAEQVDNS